MNRIEEYAVWLAETGIDDSAHEDLNEGGDPLSADGEELDDDEWREAKDLAREMAGAVRDNPEAFLAWVASVKPVPEADPADSASGLCESGPDGVTCVVADETHRGIYHSGRPVPGYAS